MLPLIGIPGTLEPEYFPHFKGKCQNILNYVLMGQGGKVSLEKIILINLREFMKRSLKCLRKTTCYETYGCKTYGCEYYGCEYYGCMVTRCIVTRPLVARPMVVSPMVIKPMVVRPTVI